MYMSLYESAACVGNAIGNCSGNYHFEVSPRKKYDDSVVVARQVTRAVSGPQIQ